MLETTTAADQPTALDPPHHQYDGSVVAAHRSWTWLYGVVFIVTAAVIAFNILRPITVLPRITPAPGYALVNEQGDIVNSEAHRGKLTLYSFTHTDCAEPCAQSAGQIADVQATLAERLPADVDIDLVTISVDPAYDTPERLNQLKQSVIGSSNPDARVPWTLLTGDPLRTRIAIGRGFSVYFGEPKVSELSHVKRSVTFDPRYVLVDGWGVIRAEYRTATPDPEILERDVNLLMQEARNSNGLVKLGYEAAHLFACYPR